MICNQELVLASVNERAGRIGTHIVCGGTVTRRDHEHDGEVLNALFD
jgi:hypothetical protein